MSPPIGSALTWFDPPQPVAEDLVAALERDLGVVFPEDYRLFLINYQGGVPNQTDFEIDDPRKRNVGVGQFLGVARERHAEFITGALDILHGRLPARMIPIGIGGGGDFVLLDLRQEQPQIVYWHHEREGLKDQFTFVAPSFTDFLSMLHQPDIDAESKLD